MMPMIEVSTNPEYSPKRETITTFEYIEGLVVKQTETVYEAVKTEDKVISVKSVEHDQVDKLIDAGYQPKDYFAKSVIMILTESANEEVMAKLKAKLDAEREES